MEYTQVIDGQIGEQLRARGRVRPLDLAGIPDEDGLGFLARFAQIHGSETGAVFDGSELKIAPQAAAPSVAAPLSPVDHVLQNPMGPSALDTQRAGEHVPAWWWLLPLSFMFVGGIIAWWFLREHNKTVANAMLIVGVIVTVLTAAVAGPTMALLSGMVPQ